jgi:hypothetical protein
VSDTPHIVERLRDLAAVAADVDEAPCSLIDGFHAAADEIERLRERILHLEAASILARGHLTAALRPEQPFSIEHNVPGNAPT